MIAILAANDCGSLHISGLFDGEHATSAWEGRTGGWLPLPPGGAALGRAAAPLLGAGLLEVTRRGCEAMVGALKARAEG